ncbi:hypothetical protein [Legionella nagasakiensis]|uniref:hypothetical protein n=1 Tax=Legionella nagasakiensis TaxID=535290 RepID=UPI0010544EE5|nr:hypothetical protein [Legionella nagasakiensis]
MTPNHLAKLKETICSVHGQKGLEWWNNLPHLLESLAHTHKLTLNLPFTDLNFNYVLPVLGPNQEEWVLKLCANQSAKISIDKNGYQKYHVSR